MATNNPQPLLRPPTPQKQPPAHPPTCNGHLSPTPCPECHRLRNGTPTPKPWYRTSYQRPQPTSAPPFPHPYPDRHRHRQPEEQDSNRAGKKEKLEKEDSATPADDDAANDLRLCTLFAAASLTFSPSRSPNPSPNKQNAPPHHQQQEEYSAENRWCEACFTAFPTRSHRDAHIKASWATHPTCTLCLDPTLYATRAELRSRHICTTLRTCRYCRPESTHAGNEALERHWREKHITCGKCEAGLVFADVAGLEGHVRGWHGECVCGVCGMVFFPGKGDGDWEKEKERHVQEKHMQWCRHCEGYVGGMLDHGLRWCHFCRVEFGDSKGKREHMEARHRGQCEGCAFGSGESGEVCGMHERERRDEEERRAREDESREEAENRWKRERGRGLRGKMGAPRPAAQDANPNGIPPGMEDFYAILRVGRGASDEEIKKAAKERRIETHPDRLERQDGLDEGQVRRIRENAKKVGGAADILCNPLQRTDYERKIERGWGAIRRESGKSYWYKDSE